MMHAVLSRAVEDVLEPLNPRPVISANETSMEKELVICHPHSSGKGDFGIEDWSVDQFADRTVNGLHVALTECSGEVEVFGRVVDAVSCPQEADFMAQSVKPIIQEIIEDENDEISSPGVLRGDEDTLESGILGPEILLEKVEELAIQSPKSEKTDDYITHDELSETGADGAPSVNNIVVASNRGILGHTEEDVFDDAADQKEWDRTEKIILDGSDIVLFACVVVGDDGNRSG